MTLYNKVNNQAVVFLEFVKIFGSTNYKNLGHHALVNNQKFCNIFFNALQFSNSITKFEPLLTPFYGKNNFVLKKNRYYHLKKTNLFRLFFKYRKRSFRFIVRYNNFITFLKLNKIKMKSVFNPKYLPSYTIVSYFKKQYLSVFLRNWHFLTGNLISSAYWGIVNRPKRFKRSVFSRFLKNAKKFRKTPYGKLPSNIFKNKSFLRKIYINNFFYLNKINIKFNEMKYLLKLNIKNARKSTFNWSLTRPYLFLNSNITYKLPFSFYSFFLPSFLKRHSKIFTLIKRNSPTPRRLLDNVFCSLKKNIINRAGFFSMPYGLIYSELNFDKNTSRIRTLFSRKNFKNYRNLISAQLKFRKRFRRRTLKFYYSKIFDRGLNDNFLSSQFRAERYLTNRIAINEKCTHFSKNLFFKRRNFRKIVMLFTSFKFYTKFYTGLRHLNRKFYKKPFRTLLLNLKKFRYFKFYNKFFSPLLSNYKWTQRLYSRPKISYNLYLENKFYKSFSHNNFRSSKIFSCNVKPLFFSRGRTKFSLGPYGFIFITETLPAFGVKNKMIVDIRKSLSSFSHKNDLQKFVMRRYMRYHFPFHYNRVLNSRNPLISSSTSDKFTSFSNFSNKSHYSAYMCGSAFLSKNWAYLTDQLTYWRNYAKEDINLSIKRIRFKPGYMTMWRDAREVLKLSLGLKMRYQYRVTRYLLRYNKFVKFGTYLAIEMQLINILIKARFLIDYSAILLFINSDLIFVNGCICANPFFQLVMGDLVQLIITLKYYVLYRWFLNWSLKKKIRLKHIARKKLSKPHNIEEKQKSYLLPHWILFNKNSLNDVSKYLEVDYFTLSAVILYEPFLWSDIGTYSVIGNKFSIINTYNWKYIT